MAIGSHLRYVVVLRVVNTEKGGIKMRRITMLAVLVSFLLLGCKAGPTKKSEFMGDTKGMVRDTTIEAVHEVWVSPDVKWEKFKKIHVAPVNIQYIREWTGWEKMSLAEFDPEDFRELADFTRQTFIEALQNNENENAPKVVDRPDPETLILELAIIKVVPTKVWLNTVAYAGIWMAVDKGSIAMEGRLRDGETSEIIVKFIDLERGKDSLLNIKDLTWYSHVKTVIEEWAQQFVQTVNSEEGEIIKDSTFIELKPW